MDAGVPAGMWGCPVCTLHNDNARTTCSVCGYKRQKQPGLTATPGSPGPQAPPPQDAKTAFIDAALHGDLAKCQQLADRVADIPNLKVEMCGTVKCNGNTILYEACRQRVAVVNPEVVLFLLNKECDPQKASGGFGSTPLHGVVEGLKSVVGNLAELQRRIEPSKRAIRYLISGGAHLAQRNFNGDSVTQDLFVLMGSHGTSNEAKELLKSLFDLFSAEIAIVRSNCTGKPDAPHPDALFHNPQAWPLCSFRPEASMLLLEQILCPARGSCGEVFLRTAAHPAEVLFAFSDKSPLCGTLAGNWQVELQIRAWPTDFHADHIVWEMLAPTGMAGWEPVPERLAEALSQRGNEYVEEGGTRYKINTTLILEGAQQPLDGYFLRWRLDPEAADVEYHEELAALDANEADEDGGVAMVRPDDVEKEIAPDPRPAPQPQPQVQMTSADGVHRGGSPRPVREAVPQPCAPAAAQAPPLRPNPPPQQWIQITLDPNGIFSAAYPSMVLLLMGALDLERKDTKLGSVTSQFQFNLHPEQQAKMRPIVEGIVLAQRGIENQQQLLLNKIPNEVTSDKDANFKLREDDPTLKILREFHEFARNHFKAIRLESTNKFMEKVRNEAAAYVDKIVARPTQATEEISKDLAIWIDNLLKEKSEKVGPNAKYELLKQFMESKSQQLQFKDREERIVYDKFIGGILQRAKVKYLLPILLRDFLIHYASVQRHLPFYTETAEKLVDSVLKNDVVVVKTGTGTGKSTMMPMILLAAGLPGPVRRIAITQPRRFAAESIYSGLSKDYGPALVGFNMAGRRKNALGRIIYYTDGLLRHTILPANELTYDIVIIDEVHERSKDIDGCISLLALRKKLGLKMPKIILSSATFDPSVEEPFKRVGLTIAHVESDPPCRFHRSEHYADHPCSPTCSKCQSLKRNAHYVTVVADLQQQLVGTEQLIVFLPSVLEVNEAAKLLGERHIRALPLHAAQAPHVQMQNVSTGRVFVSTNIAETSLTFPNLKFAIDVGKTQRPRWTPWGMQMETVDSSKSTLKQRLGRVGRTCDGEYVALYSYASLSTRPEHIQPKLELEGDEDFLFSMQLQLSTKLPQQIVLPRANNPEVSLPKLDTDFQKYPVVGSKSMTLAFHDSFKDGCSLNMLCFAAMRKTMPAKTFQAIALKAKGRFGAKGDISGAINMMTRLVCSYKGPFQATLRGEGGRTPDEQRRIQTDILESVRNWCGVNELGEYARFLQRAFMDTMNMCQVLEKNNVRLGRVDEENVGQVLLHLIRHHPKNVFVSLSTFRGPGDYFSRAQDYGDGGDDDKAPFIRTVSSFHTQCSLHRKNRDDTAAPPLVLSLDFMLFGAEMPTVENPYRLGVMQACEPLEESQVRDLPITKRRVLLLPKETAPAGCKTESRDGKTFMVFSGSLKSVLDSIKAAMQSLDVDEAIPVALASADPTVQNQFNHNLATLKQHKFEIFRQLKLNWRNACALEITAELGAQPPQFKAKGRGGEVATLKDHLNFWTRQLSMTPAVHPLEHFSTISSFIRPAAFPQGDADFRARLRFVTEPNVDPLKIWELAQGPYATRETRMMVVARISILNFECRVSGGFVRDWIVRGFSKHPPNKPDPLNPSSLWDNDWVGPAGNVFIQYDMKEGVIPKDIDAELPCDKYFDVYRFISDVRAAGIEVDYHQYVAQRHVFIFDVKTGPFTVDFVDFHFAMLHTMADFDVNMLALMSPCENLVGLKVEASESGGAALSVDSIIGNILSEKLVVMRPRDNLVMGRIDKMKSRGWKLVEPDRIFQPVADQPNCATFLRVYDSDPDIQEHLQKFKKMKATDIVVYRVQNSITQKLYDATKQRIVAASGNANERVLYHGTKHDAVKCVIDKGFDSRFWSGGNGAAFGRAAYFAPIPEMSDNFTDRPGPRYILVCKVTLGNTVSIEAKHPEYFPPAGVDSTTGRESHWFPNDDQFMIYKENQALPLYLFRYSRSSP